QPLEDRLVPPLAVLRLEHPMPFIRKIKQLRGDAFALERGEQAQALADRHAKIEFVVDDKIGRLEIRGKAVRRKFVEVWSLPRDSVFPFIEPQFLRGAVHRPEIE